LFGMAVPLEVAGLPAATLDPRRSWADPAAYDTAAKRLLTLFAENYRRFEPDRAAAE
jgi:phosphoenolpyruvate carboxykinase (ATP)